MKCIPSFIKGLIPVAVLLAVWTPCAAFADIGGSMELNYNNITSRTDSRITGLRTNERQEGFEELYNLMYRAQLTPYLGLNLGYVYDQSFNASRSSEDVATRRSMSLRTSPYVDLTLANPLFSTRAGFRRTEQRQRPGGADLFSDTYNFNFNLKTKEKQPTLAILYSRAYLYDRYRESQNIVGDSASLASNYSPTQELSFGYLLSYNDSQNRIADIETSNLSNTGRASYGTGFFDRRITFNTNYQATYTESETKFPTGTTANVTLPVTPTQGIGGSGPAGSITPPETPVFETMVSKPILIDSNDVLPSDINIGYSPQNQNFRSMGIVVAAPTDMNLLYVVVDQDITAIAASYTWDVYISTDRTPVGSGPKQWTLWQQAAPATFNSFDRRFEISFSSVQTQFIKVVTRPLSSPLPVPPININSILVTELRAFNNVTAAQAKGLTARRSVSQLYDLGARAVLLEAPVLLSYDVYYTASETRPGLRQSTLSNGISALRRFSSIFSGSARVSRDDIDSNARGFERETIYMASASLVATPLPTLSHNLVLSAQRDQTGGRVTSSQSAFLGNTAQLYEGVSVNLSGSTSNSSVSDTGSKTRGETFTAGLSLVPHRLLSVNASHSDAASRQTTPGASETSSRTSTDSVTIAYTPVPAIYLTASYDVSATRGAGRTANELLSASWSPFAGGRLVFTFNYSQQIALPSRDKTTIYGPTVQWRVNDRLFLTSSYSQIKLQTASATITSDNLAVNVRWLF